MRCFGGLIAHGFLRVGVSFSPVSPHAFTPSGGEGELEQPIRFFWGWIRVLVRKLAVRVCSPVLGNVAVVVIGVGLGTAARCS